MPVPHKYIPELFEIIQKFVPPKDVGKLLDHLEVVDATQDSSYRETIARLRKHYGEVMPRAMQETRRVAATKKRSREAT